MPARLTRQCEVSVTSGRPTTATSNRSSGDITVQARSTHRLASVVVAVVLVAVAGVASAYWLSSGQGAGSATAGTTVAVSLSPGTAAPNLYPGGRTDVVLTVANSNPSSVFVGSLQLDAARGSGGFAVDANHSGCVVSTLGYTAQTNAGVGWTIPPRAGAVNGSLPITLTSALAMSGSAANACQGATFTIYLSASA